MIKVSIFCVFSVCGKTKADIVFLVDESSSIGANNFNKIKDFIFRVTTYFPAIGPQDTQVSVTVKNVFLVPLLCCVDVMARGKYLFGC